LKILLEFVLVADVVEAIIDVVAILVALVVIVENEDVILTADPLLQITPFESKHLIIDLELIF
jgi:hypothetical protein